ncbi:alpha/beta hydrolase [Luteimonas sp. XNQY3]|nr:alpha/beta fold hydrolase [Luteimonas sp. XNQY3]MCD9006584.1 alpha/beta hydrolase [Luteimonas sp. XNQY3]
MQSRSARGLMAIALCVAMAGCTYSLHESHLVRPMPAPPPDLAALTAAHAGYTATESRIDTPDGVSVYRIDFKRADARATVLYFGGNGFRTGLHARRILDAYAGLPVDLVLVDHRGYGASTGSPTIDGMRADALQVYDQVRAGTTDRPLIVHGQSLGSFFAGHVADARQLDGLVLESSMTTAEDWTRAMRARAGFWTRLAVRRFDIAPALQKAGNLEVARRLDEPVLYVVGELDATTAPRFSQALFDATPVPAADRQLVVVPGRGHNDATLSPEFGVAFAALLARASAD